MPTDRSTTPSPAKRLGRAERRAQLITAATHAFATAGGYTHTSLDDVATAAGITRVILYRHFDSKTDLYQAVIDHAAERLHAAATRDGDLHDDSVTRVIDHARTDPDGFRILFRHAAIEPEFHRDVETIKAAMVEQVRPHLTELATDQRWADWAARLATVVLIEAILAWLDAGQPDPEQATKRIRLAVEGAVTAIAAV